MRPWSDYKIREVSDKVWIIYGPIALALSLAGLLLYAPGDLTRLRFNGGVDSCVFSVAVLRWRVWGADSKAFMCIALALPAYPTVLMTPILATKGYRRLANSSSP
jgi:hypothetical protein